LSTLDSLRQVSEMYSGDETVYMALRGGLPVGWKLAITSSDVPFASLNGADVLVAGPYALHASGGDRVPNESVMAFRFSAVDPSVDSLYAQGSLRLMRFDPITGRSDASQVTVIHSGTTAMEAAAVIDSLGMFALVGTPRGTTGVKDTAPGVTRVGAPRPNPAFGPVAMEFSVATRQVVDIAVVDIAGRLVKMLSNAKTFAPGQHEILWNGTDDRGRAVRPGVYFIRVRHDGGVEARRIVLLR